MKYTWNNTGFSADANKIGRELEQINDISELTNKEVLEYAEKHRDSELAKCFDWDDKSASRKWRLTQATQVLCNIAIVIKDEPIEKTRVYVSTRKKDDEKRTFKKLVDVLDDDEEYKALVEKAKTELNNCQDKYRNIVRLQDLKDIIFDMYKNL